VDQKLTPGVAALLDALVQDPNTPPSTKTTLLGLFDIDKDGSIAADEVKNSALLGVLLKADVDLDKDGTPDHMSAGMAFTSVSCVIQ
jgi:hypothetical protein